MRLLQLDVGGYKRFVQPFTLSLERRGLVLIEGENRDALAASDSNGAGKSTLLEPIAWVFFNKIPRHGAKRLGSEDVCWDGHDADVTVTFETHLGRFQARRRRRASSGATTFTIESWNGDEFLPLAGLSADVALATGDLSTMIGFDYQTFRHAFCLHGQGFGIAAGGFSAQMKALEAALRFDLFTRAAEAASRGSKTLHAQVADVVREIEQHSHVQQEARGVLRDLESLDESARDRELVALIADHEAASADLDAHRKQLTECERGESDVARDVSRCLAELDLAIDHRRALAKDSERATCSHCEQPVSDAMRDALRVRVDERIKHAKLAHAAALELQRKRTRRADFIRDAIGVAERAERELGQCRRELADLRTRASRRLAMIATSARRIDDAEVELSRLTNLVADARIAARDSATFAKAYANEIKASVLHAAEPVLNHAAVRYGEQLTAGAFTYAFDLLRSTSAENMLVIRDERGTIREYAELSSGEQRRTDLVVALALRDVARWRLNGETLNFSLWDEVFDPLDATGLSRSIQLLQRDLDELESVFVVTHSVALKQQFPGAHVVRVIREDGQSCVEA